MIKTFLINELDDTNTIACKIAGVVKPGDIITLKGDLGAGKTEFSRAFIRYFLGIEQEVPSPTFTLVQIYETALAPIWHLDLYRLKHADEVWELGFEEALMDNIVLIEWPERLGSLPLSNHLNITFYLNADDGKRFLSFEPDSTWVNRLPQI